MKKYFIYQENQQIGPLTFEELQERNVGKDTMVWFDGLAEWKKAGDLLELNDLFQAGPPPVPAGTYGPGAQQSSNAGTYGSTQPVYGPNLNAGAKPKNWLVESILVTLFCCLPFGIVAIVQAARVDSRFAAGDLQGALQSSKEAGKWTSISFFVGLAVGVIYMIYMVAMIGSLSQF